MVDHLPRRPPFGVLEVECRQIKRGSLLKKGACCRLVGGDAWRVQLHFPATQLIMFAMSGAKPSHFTNGSGHQCGPMSDVQTSDRPLPT